MNFNYLESELKFRFSRSSGKGGQNVNKVETRVELLFDVAGSVYLEAEEKARIQERLASRINQDGLLIVAASEHRSQHRNRKEALHRFFQLIESALREEKPAKGHKPRKPNQQDRLRKKKAHSLKKALRVSVPLPA
jgi:ribosome-associated protein